jgi:hypothetical protein
VRIRLKVFFGQYHENETEESDDQN